MFLVLPETRVELFWQLVAGLGPRSGGRTAVFAGGSAGILTKGCSSALVGLACHSEGMLFGEVA